MAGARPVRPGEIAVVFRRPQDAGGLVRRGLRPPGHSRGVRIGPGARSLAGPAGAGGAAATGPRRLAVRSLLAVLGSNYFQPDWPEWQGGRPRPTSSGRFAGCKSRDGRRPLIEQLADCGGERPAVERPATPRSRLAVLGRLAAALGCACPSGPRCPTGPRPGSGWPKQTGLLEAMATDSDAEPDIRHDSPSAPHPHHPRSSGTILFPTAAPGTG